MKVCACGCGEPVKRRFVRGHNLPQFRGELPAGAWAPGAAPNLKHGLRTRQPSGEVLDPILDQILVDLESKVPIRDQDGDVPAWLREMAWSAGIAKLRVVRCKRFLDQHGETDERGKWRPENEELRKANESYQRSLDRLAMTVGSHLRAGLDFKRAQEFDLAKHWQEQEADDGA